MRLLSPPCDQQTVYDQDIKLLHRGATGDAEHLAGDIARKI
jgi:hypothetical protein